LGAAQEGITTNQLALQVATTQLQLPVGNGCLPRPVHPA
jgi:hypothetical protein